MATSALLYNRVIDLCLPPVAKEHSNETMSSDNNKFKSNTCIPITNTTDYISTQSTTAESITAELIPRFSIKFGSKEAYPHKSETSPIQKYLDQAKSVHSVIRHGYRYPSEKDMQNFKILFPKHEFRWVPSDGSQLTENGKKEQQRLGRV